MENKVIFESEEEVKKFYTKHVIHEPSMDEFIKELKEDNCIRKSPVEEAEYRYENIKQYHTEDNSDAWRLVILYHNSIKQQLKNKE